MPQDDLSSWLKASAENKITARNAWQATLIEHFVDTGKSTAKDGFSFQRASTTLEGCMKVYSTRVDDVSDSTMKLLEMFSKGEDKKKASGRKRQSFIEKSPANINLKERETADFYDPLFSSILLKSDEYFLMDILEPTGSGAVVYGHWGREIVMEDERVELGIEQLPMCHSLKDFEVAIKGEYAEEEFEAEMYDEGEFGMDDVDQECDQGCDQGYGQEVDQGYGQVCGQAEHLTVGQVCGQGIEQLELNVFNETPFGYFKGWAGPTHWKVQIGLKGKKDAVKKPRQRFFLDFAGALDQSLLECKCETVLTKEAILERRKNKNFLPEDYTYEVKDLYRFQKADGHFGVHRASSPASSDACCDVEMDDPPYDIEMDTAAPSLELPLAEGPELHLKFTRTAKRVNIKRLKENLSGLLMQNCDRFSQVVGRLPGLYSPKEAKDISPHFCLISLLHLANEMEFDLKAGEGDLIICKPFVQ